MIVPVAAVADTVATSAASFRTIALADDVPENVCVPVKVLATLTTAILAAASVVAPLPPLAIGNVPVIFVAALTKVVDVLPVPPLAMGSVPVTPVDRGKPVAFVNVPLAGVPSTGAVSVGEVSVLLVKVSEPAKVASVPVVGKVTFVVPVGVRV